MYKRKLGDLLLSKRIITVTQLQHALKTQSEKGKKLGELLVELGYISEEQLEAALTEQGSLKK